MLLFPNAKINIGLRITGRRPDGYHDIDTLMVPVKWCDVLEYHELPVEQTDILTLSGNELDCTSADNIVMKALRLLREAGVKVPPAELMLEKHIPSQAGLGGGSADAAFLLTAIGREHGMTDEQIAGIAAKAGADCPFFVYNRPMHATGTGTTLTPFDASPWAHLGLAVAKADCAAVSTAQAYAGVAPAPLPPGTSLTDAFRRDPRFWEQDGVLVNDFEANVIARVPVIGDIKRRFRDAGAMYSAMSGSGSAVFALFSTPAEASACAPLFADCQFYCGNLGGD